MSSVLEWWTIIPLLFFLQAINPCSKKVCDPNANCIYLGPNHHKCACQEGYKGDGQVCLPIDPCQAIYGNCPAQSTICIYDGPGKVSVELVLQMFPWSAAQGKKLLCLQKEAMRVQAQASGKPRSTPGFGISLAGGQEGPHFFLYLHMLVCFPLKTGMTFVWSFLWNVLAQICFL